LGKNLELPFEEQKEIIVELEHRFSISDKICTQVDADKNVLNVFVNQFSKKSFFRPACFQKQ